MFQTAHALLGGGFDHMPSSCEYVVFLGQPSVIGVALACISSTRHTELHPHTLPDRLNTHCLYKCASLITQPWKPSSSVTACLAIEIKGFFQRPENVQTTLTISLNYLQLFLHPRYSFLRSEQESNSSQHLTP